MRTAGVAFVLACLVSALLTPFVRRFALARGLFDDQVLARKIHGRPVPRLGGVAIAAGFYVPLLALLLQASSVGQMFYKNMRMSVAFLLGGLVICGLGLVDDVRGAGAGKKFLVQFVVAGALFAAGIRIEHLTLPFVGSFALGALSLPFTLLWVVGVINALNLIDGLDGLAAGVAFFGVATTFAIAFLRQDPLMMLFMGALAGAIVGFWAYNFNPASIFMGDTGSMFLGYVLGVGAMQTSQKSSTVVAILVPIVALGLPIADTFLAILRRTIAGRPIFSADRQHIHHRLLDMGLSQRKAVFTLYGASIILGVVALLLTLANSAETALILAATGLLGYLGFKRLGYRPAWRHAGAQPPADAQVAYAGLAHASDERHLWRELRATSESLGITALRLSLEEQVDGDTITRSTRPNGNGPWHSVEVAPTDAVLMRMDYCRRAGELDARTIEPLKQALAAACARLFGPEAEGRGEQASGGIVSSARIAGAEGRDGDEGARPAGATS
jgi:UDP-GlcNAc:undecaprenyl-phosphate GlcNAc-1-phosphate transferase